jgi:cytoskeletal protein CcmA (bactofilin family)
VASIKAFFTEKAMAAVSSTTSVLGRKISFKGDLIADEDLLIEGSVEGSVTHSGALTIGASAIIKARVNAQSIIVEGDVQGDLSAEQSIKVMAGAKIRGNLRAPTISILEGAAFTGGIDMSKPGVVAQPAKVLAVVGAGSPR